MKVIKIKFEYGCFPVWIYGENNEFPENIDYAETGSRQISFDVLYTIDEMPFFKHIENQEVYMEKNFEDKFMEIQTNLIELCLEVTENKVDKIYAYASIEKKSTMFNAFFESKGKVLTINQLNFDKKTVMQFLRIGTTDLEKIRSLCEKNDIQTPTELKMYYDVQNGKYNVDYKYDEVCSERTGISSGEVFMKWYNEIMNQSV